MSVIEPVRVPGVADKIIDEFIGHASTGSKDVSIAKMKSPAGWSEPGQRPTFDEYTIVLSGEVVVTTESGEFMIGPNQAYHARAGDWIRYSTPNGAEYIAVCNPAFSLETVNRDG